MIDCALNWKFLPNKQFPIIFESVIGITETEQDHSSFNLMEMDKVLEYIGKLLRFGINGKSIMQTDIGVVTPYRKQCLKLRMKFNDKKWNDIEVGSVEQYQGREKKVVILTTVRSNTDNVGFLNNPKVSCRVTCMLCMYYILLFIFYYDHKNNSVSMLHSHVLNPC